MTQAKLKPLTFADFLEYDDGSDAWYDLLSDGSLVEVTSEAEINSRLAMALVVQFLNVVDYALIKINTLELEVNPIGDNRVNRRPDLAILDPEHLKIDSIVRRTALFRGDLPPRLVAEVVSPGNENSESYLRDYEWKRQQYQNWGIPEYWILDPHREQISVLVLTKGAYQSMTYQADQVIKSTEFPSLKMTVNELLHG